MCMIDCWLCLYIKFCFLQICLMSLTLKSIAQIDLFLYYFLYIHVYVENKYNQGGVASGKERWALRCRTDEPANR